MSQLIPQMINPNAGPGASAAVNDTAISGILAQAGHTGLPVFLSPGDWQISQPVSLGYFQTLFGSNRGTTKLIQNTGNTPVLQVTGPSIHVHDLTLTYSSPQASSNANSYGIEWNASSSDFLYESTFERITVDSAAIGFGVAGGIGSPGNSEFQNSWTDCFARNCSGFALILIGGSGSQWTNLRVEGSGGIPSSPDCIGGIYIDNVDQTVFNTLNIEHIYPSSGKLLELHNQCMVVANSLHFEGLNNPTDFEVTPIYIGFQAALVGVAVKLIFSTISGHMRWCYMPASQNATVDLNAFEAYGNTVASGKKIAWAESADSSNEIVLRDFGQRNQYADLILPNRNGLQTVGSYQFAGPGGQIVFGPTSATTPASAMSAPFQAYDGTPTAWQAGDRVQSTNPSSGNTSWVRTAGGAWITN